MTRRFIVVGSLRIKRLFLHVLSWQRRLFGRISQKETQIYGARKKDWNKCFYILFFKVYGKVTKAKKSQNRGRIAAACIFGECAFNNFEIAKRKFRPAATDTQSAAPFFFVERKRQTFQCSTNGDLPKQKKFAEDFSGCLRIRGSFKDGILSKLNHVLQKKIIIWFSSEIVVVVL